AVSDLTVRVRPPAIAAAVRSDGTRMSLTDPDVGECHAAAHELWRSRRADCAGAERSSAPAIGGARSRDAAGHARTGGKFREQQSAGDWHWRGSLDRRRSVAERSGCVVSPAIADTGRRQAT